ncbi:MAG TPA: NADPH dehydrogenase [Erysipelothrix sp.]|nr:NADPH dehydrogenase [Erysipelothrix sp.]
MKLFEETQIKNTTLKNRFVMAPMCMYSVYKKDGVATPFHLAHYMARAIGQVGLIIIEATGIVPEGRISDECLGLWNDTQKEAFKPIVKGVQNEGSKIAIQLNHAGRKCTTDDEVIVAPSSIAYSDRYRIPKELSQQDIKQVIMDFTLAAKRADEAGFDMIELHMAHGYLLSSFMSPITNKRIDKYRDASVLYKELMDSIKTVWPKEKPILVRVSATDYEKDGYNVEHVAKVLEPIIDDIDVIHVSSGGITPIRPKSYPSYQVAFATKLKKLTQKPVIAVGLIDTIEQSMDIIENDRADFIGLGRILLRQPHFVLDALNKYDFKDKLPHQYVRGYKV